MLSIEKYILNYRLLVRYQEYLNSLLFIPIDEEELNSKILITEQSKLSEIETIIQKPLCCEYVDKEELLFFLKDIDIKIKIYEIVSLRLHSDYFNENITNDFFYFLFEFAIKKRSSDIHIEARTDSFVIRFRIDGILYQFFRFEKELFDIVSSVIKLKCNLDITQKRVPQGGRYSQNLAGEDVDFRVSILPTIDGESIVIRILRSDKDTFCLNSLNILDNELKIIKRKIELNSGLIILTGPTGSGKTTSLYALMKEFNLESQKIISIEDPIEYKIEGVSQIAVNSEIGLTYYEILKNILRQDPNILIIGEIRDKESLKIAIQASLTGHLVITTLHTNDAVSSISRLLDLEAEPFLIASVLKMVIAQRLVLKLCNKCKQKIENAYKEFGCKECNMSGFSGRNILTEVLQIDQNISKMITEKVDMSQIRDYAKERLGFRTFDEVKDELVFNGISTLKEIYRVI